MATTSFPVSRVNGLAIVNTPLEIDISNAGEMRAALLDASSNGGASVIIVDMTETAFCDSTGLNVLVRAHKQASSAGTDMRLVVRQAALLRILQVTGVGPLFSTFDNLEQATHGGVTGE